MFQYGHRIFDILPPVLVIALPRYVTILFVSRLFNVGNLVPEYLKSYYNAKIILVTDPLADTQAMKEAIRIGIPVIALCDANNKTDFVDLIIPTNNKGRMSLAVIYWLLAREILKNRGEIKSYDEMKSKIDDFEVQI